MTEWNLETVKLYCSNRPFQKQVKSLLAASGCEDEIKALTKAGPEPLAMLGFQVWSDNNRSTVP